MGVQVEHRERVAIVTIDREDRLNAIDPATGDALFAAFADIDSNPDVWVSVVTGAGPRAFSAGHDLTGPAGPRDTDSSLAAAIKGRRAKPCIAAVNGLALGAGLELVLACDLVVAAEHATFGVPEVRWGLIAGAGGLIRLPRRIPQAVAMEMALTGDPIDAHRAWQLGLVNRVVPATGLLAEATALAARIAANGPYAVRASRRVIAEGSGTPETEAWALNATALAAVLRSPEPAEGQAAFAGRRPPRWASPETWQAGQGAGAG